MNEEKKKVIVSFFRQIMQVYDFEIMIDINKNLENVFRLNDIQKGNLGGIEQEEFSTLADIIDRLDLYHQDYIYTPLELKQSNDEKLSKDDWDLVAKRYLENDTVAKVLSKIHTKEYVNLISKKEKFDIHDIIKILDEDEKFYKSVCEKYVNTMSKEILLKFDNKILHIYIEDEYIKWKEEGKININNYKEYLDGEFEVEEYYCYQELYNSVIKDNIAYDLNDLELFDNEGNWTFYITFEELKKVGFGYMVKDQFPLIEKYAVSEEKVFDFFDYFTLEQLEDFEQSLNQYFNEKCIIYNENSYEQLESKEDRDFNRDILRLACGLITYEDFIMDNVNENQTYYDISLDKVSEYFRENKIKNLMDYGSDKDEGLYHLSSMYKEILDKLDIKYLDVNTRDKEGSDGKFITTICFEDKTEFEVETDGWSGIKIVTNNVKEIYEEYSKSQEKSKQIKEGKDNEIDYDFN
jgi:hypothetical protein